MELKDQFVDEAKLLEEGGASLLDFTNSGPVAGPAVTAAVSIPVIGGLGGGPWLDGRVRAIGNAIGYTAAALDDDGRALCERRAYHARCDHGLRRGRPRRPADQRRRSRAGSAKRPPREPGRVRAKRERWRQRHRRNYHPLRGLRLRPAGADVLARRLRRDRREVDARRGSTRRSGRSSTCPGSSPASRSIAARAGASGGRVESVSWAHYVAQGKGLLDHLGISRAHIMGACMGCAPAMALAVAHPDVTSSLLLYWPVGGAALPDQQPRAVCRAPGVRAARRPAGGGVARAGGGQAVQPGSARRAVGRGDQERPRLRAAPMRSRSSIATCRSSARCGISCSIATPRPGRNRKHLFGVQVPALIVPGRDKTHATSAARYLEECLPRAEYWDIAVADQTAATVPPRARSRIPA